MRHVGQLLVTVQVVKAAAAGGVQLESNKN
jgi:hypothetical protein